LDNLGFEFWQGQKCPDWSWGASLGSCTMSSRFIFGKGGGLTGQGVKLTTRLHLVLRLKICVV